MVMPDKYAEEALGYARLKFMENVRLEIQILQSWEHKWQLKPQLGCDYFERRQTEKSRRPAVKLGSTAVFAALTKGSSQPRKPRAVTSRGNQESVLPGKANQG